MVDTLTIINNGTAAWEVTAFSGAGITTQIGVTNPDIELTGIGTRYEITNDGHPTHPVEFLDDQDNVLLSQSSTGSFESDSGVNWVDNDTSVEFTLTQGLSNELTTYRCTVHSAAMVGNIISPEIDYTPGTGSVSITSPAEGDVITSPFNVQMQATDFVIEAASNGPTDGAGHFHILVNQDAIPPEQAIPNNPNNGYYHYGDGSTTATLNLDPGAYTIRIQAGTANHLAYDLTDSIDIIVESNISGTPVITAANNLNGLSLETTFTAIASDSTARNSLTQSSRNLSAVSSNRYCVRGLNTNESAIVEGLCAFFDLDPANYADLSAVVADSAFVNQITDSSDALKFAAYSAKAMAAVDTAGDSMIKKFMCGTTSQVPGDFASPSAIAQDATAMAEIAQNNSTMAVMANLPTAVPLIANSTTAMQEIVSSTAAMNNIGNSALARSEILATSSALNEVTQVEMAAVKLSVGEADFDAEKYADTNDLINDDFALDKVVNTQSAIEVIASSSPALDVLGNDAVVQNTVYNTQTAVTALQNSPLTSNIDQSFRGDRDRTFKDDRSILLNFDYGAGGQARNQPVFGANSNQRPQTADQLRRTNDDNRINYNTNSDMTFIDIADP
jgi:hypothetical protein